MSCANKHNAITHNNKPRDMFGLVHFLVEEEKEETNRAPTHRPKVNNKPMHKIPDVDAYRLSVGIIQHGEAGLFI